MHSQQRLTLTMFRAWSTTLDTKLPWSDFYFAGKLRKLLSLVMVSHNPVSAHPWSNCSSPNSYHWLWISTKHKFKSRQCHTCHGDTKLDPWHFYKVWKNKWWISTLLIVASLLSQLALELAQNLHVRAGLHPSTSFVRLFESRTRCAKMLSERRAFCPTSHGSLRCTITCIQQAGWTQ